jgi:hypothetical protein
LSVCAVCCMWEEIFSATVTPAERLLASNELTTPVRSAMYQRVGLPGICAIDVVRSNDMPLKATRTLEEAPACDKAGATHVGFAGRSPRPYRVSGSAIAEEPIGLGRDARPSISIARISGIFIAVSQSRPTASPQLKSANASHDID